MTKKKDLKTSVTKTLTEVNKGTGSFPDELLEKAQAINPALVVLQGDLMGTLYRLKEGVNQIGRHPQSDLVLNQRTVSASHALLRRKGDVVVLEDQGSSNGTQINKEKATQPVVLQAGDLIKVGSYVFKYIENKLEGDLTESLQVKGSIDELTGAYNKAHIMNALRVSIDIAKSGYALSLIVIDLDHFKQVNDNFGHVAGDYVLKECCELIRTSVLRKSDILGRFGGEEFIVILPDMELGQAVSVAERIRTTIQVHPFSYDDKKIPVTASLGVCEWNAKYKTEVEFLEAADALVYYSKEQGRNRVSK